VEKEQHLQLSRKKNKRAAVLGLSNKMSEFISIKVLPKPKKGCGRRGV
jgi:hypothetical protein